MQPRTSDGGGAPGRWQLRALVIDDSAFDRRHVARECATLGIATDGAGTTSEAVERLQVASYDIVFIDHRLGAMSGIEALATIEQAGHAPAVRVLLTGNEDPRIARDALSHGFTACVTKSRFDRSALLGLVSSVAQQEGQA